ncbi:hypothetical protein NM688_g5354 [Phlebia brevispora]|uniref:Uncharacterized protein n=1 Tax=Phlebia brevispora TaxID=194682 RepID=A0ACC1SWI1_9APHY|nr:hypothetical protein NM688_g5354 [Phlebia brevispora]
MDSTPFPDIPAILKAAGITLGSTFGVVYFGVAFSSMSRKARSDNWFLKSVVALMWILDSAHQALVIHLCYYYLILEYGNPMALGVNVWSLPSQMLLNIVIAFFVQSFLVSRLWRLSRNVWITVFCYWVAWVRSEFVPDAESVLTLSPLSGVYLYYPVKLFMYRELEVAEDQLQSKAVAGLSAALIADLAIAAATSFYLYRSRTGFRSLDGIIARLIALSFTTGILTTCFEFAIFILASRSLHIVLSIGDLRQYVLQLLVDKRTFYDLAVGFVISKLYANTLLITLNTRESIRGSKENYETMLFESVPLSALRREKVTEVTPPTINVVVSRTVETDESTLRASTVKLDKSESSATGSQITVKDIGYAV